MNQEKIGKFIAKCRKEKKLTQQELADKLLLTDKAISKWENGRCMPDISLLESISKELGITVNELIRGERIPDTEYKEKTDENLLNLLENTTFTLKEKIAYFKKKWLKEHYFFIGIQIILLILIFAAGKIYNNAILLGALGGIALVFYIFTYNKMMIYVENNAYKKIE